MTPDSELLRRFAKTNSEDAFAELVKRHVNLVYSAAFRQVGGDAHLAQDVAQMVFADLARKAGSLARRESLTGWLYTSAHFAAAKIARTENRRRDREEKFMREPTNENEVGRVTPCAPDWEQIRPMLDKVMHELQETDREAILLRYFENRPFGEVGAKLGLNENAARMRVERALEKLRAILTKRGVTTVTALASVISANAVQVAPVGLVTTLTTASIASAGTGTFTLLKFMTMAKLKLGISALVAAGAATALVVQQQTQTKLRDESESLRQQIAQLKTDNESLSNLAAETKSPQSLPNDQLNELLKLRGEVTRLRAGANLASDPFVQMALTWKAREDQLRKLFEERPDQRIPELQFVTDREWLDIARDSALDSETGIHAALGVVRFHAQNTFASKMQHALNKFMEANNGNSPDVLSQLKPFFDTPIDDAALQRYEILSNDVLRVGWLQGAVIAEKPDMVIDKYMDRTFVIGPKTIGTAPLPEPRRLPFPKELGPVMKSYLAGHDGQAPKDITGLKPYVTTPEQGAALENLIKAMTPNQ